jgi:hypothetical protein
MLSPASAPQLYVAVYLNRPPTAPADNESAIAAAYYSAITSAGSWPYDIGDDPAFFASEHTGGPITWGICRRDVRSAINPGDWVAFFSATRDNTSKTTAYRFAATARVAEKVTQTSIFDGNPRPFRDYLNLVVRPHDTGWMHYEPGVPVKEWHDDWLWRICERGLGKEATIRAQNDHRPGMPLPVSVGKNYVVFESSRTVVTANPPIVAYHYSGSPREIWQPDAMSRKIHELIFGDSSRGLRIKNLQRPHRHLRRAFGMNEREWLNELNVALRQT